MPTELVGGGYATDVVLDKRQVNSTPLRVLCELQLHHRLSLAHNDASHAQRQHPRTG